MTTQLNLICRLKTGPSPVDPVRRKAGLLLAAGVIAVLAGAAAGQTTRPAGAGQALKLAPPGCLGVIHVDVPAVAKEALPQLRARKAAFPKLKLEKIEALSAKIKTADLFFVSKGDDGGPRVLLILHGGLTVKDVQEFARAVGIEKFALKKAGFGRYDSTQESGRVRVVFGDEAAGIAKGVILVGSRDMLTGAFIKQLGTGRTEPIRKLLAEVNTSAPMWVAVVLPPEAEEDAPRSIWGHADIRPGGKTVVSLRFKTARAAGRVEGEINAENSPVRGVFQVERADALVSLRAEREEGFTGKIIESVIRTRRMRKLVSSMAQLHAIGKALAMYAADKNDRVPKHLGELVLSGTISVETLVSPLGNTPKKGWDPKAGKIPGDYVYLAVPASKVPADLAAALIQAYELPELHRGEGTHVLYVDGHVSSLKPDQFEAQLKLTLTWLAKNR